jgi:hypothetical protein
MTARRPSSAAPGPLEAYARAFDDFFSVVAQREAFRAYLQGLLLSVVAGSATAAAHTPPATPLRWRPAPTAGGSGGSHDGPSAAPLRLAPA